MGTKPSTVEHAREGVRQHQLAVAGSDKAAQNGGANVNIHAERNLIGAVLLDPSQYDRAVCVTKREHFASDLNGSAWEVFGEFAEQGREITFEAVRDTLVRRGVIPDEKPFRELLVEYITLTERLATIEPVEALAARLRGLWSIRELRELCRTVVSETAKDVGPIQPYLEKTADRMQELSRIETTSRRAVTIFDGMKSAFMAHLERTQTRPLQYPLAKLNEKLMGLYPSELIFIGGRPGMGKTAMLMQIAVEAARSQVGLEKPKGALLVSCEMSERELMLRTACSHARVSLLDVRADQNNVKRLSADEWAKITSAANDTRHLPLYIAELDSPTPMRLRSKAKEVRAQLRHDGAELGLIVVDYLGLMDGTSPRENRNSEQQIAACTKALKSLAKELKVPVVVGAQLKRTEKPIRPQLSDIRGSGAAEQDADVVVFIHRQEYYLREETPNDWKGIAELIIAKHRNGPTGTAYARWYDRYTLFADLPSNCQPERYDD